MWYLAQGDSDRWLQRICLAASDDGYNWQKVELGLVKYNGSRCNLVDILDGEHDIVACVVYLESVKIMQPTAMILLNQIQIEKCKLLEFF